MIDLAYIKINAGNGGDGAVSFRREKFIPRGGPDGGDGGLGGSVFAVADHNLATLIDFKSKSHYKAGNGQYGRGKNQRGPDGDDLVLRLPLGTLIYEIKGTKEVLIADMNEHGKEVLLAKGGKGGVGNYRFKSSTNQTPRQYTKGVPGEEKEIKLEIKLIADVGLLGAPNAGKSTLVNRLTSSNAKVANYPFTTLSPNLGVLRLKNGQKVVISDIPGLIEGASEGKGLGDEFLRHVERARLLVHIVDPYDEEKEDLVKSALTKYDMIQKELVDYKEELAEKKQIVVINKMDITEVKDAFEDIKKAFKKKREVDVTGISAATGEGMEELTILVTKLLEEIPQKTFIQDEIPVKMYTINDLPNKRIVYGESKVFELE